MKSISPNDNTSIIIQRDSSSSTDTTDTFNGFSDQFNFTSSVLCMATFGIGAILLSCFPHFCTSLIAIIWTIACFRWLQIHGQKMTRNEVIYFEARNLLELDPPVFRFGLPAIDDDCLTPGDGQQREMPEPQSLWDALFSDEKKILMNKFYQRHYGGLHAHGAKMLAEYEMEKANEKEKEKQKSSIPP